MIVKLGRIWKIWNLGKYSNLDEQMIQIDISTNNYQVNKIYLKSKRIIEKDEICFVEKIKFNRLKLSELTNSVRQLRYWAYF
jgi:hypothetical protein